MLLSFSWKTLLELCETCQKSTSTTPHPHPKKKQVDRIPCDIKDDPPLTRQERTCPVSTALTGTLSSVAKDVDAYTTHPWSV